MNAGTEPTEDRRVAGGWCGKGCRRRLRGAHSVATGTPSSLTASSTARDARSPAVRLPLLPRRSRRRRRSHGRAKSRGARQSIGLSFDCTRRDLGRIKGPSNRQSCEASRRRSSLLVANIVIGIPILCTTNSGRYPAEFHLVLPSAKIKVFWRIRWLLVDGRLNMVPRQQTSYRPNDPKSVKMVRKVKK